MLPCTRQGIPAPCHGVRSKGHRGDQRLRRVAGKP